MYPFRKITFPVDFSDTCKAAVPYVRDTVDRYGAQLSLVHAFGWEVIGSGELAFDAPALEQNLKEADRERLRKFAAESFPGLKVDQSMRAGEPGSIIRQWVEHQQSDLVMLPTHGRGAMRRLLLGSVAAKVLHDVSAAVWTATPRVLAKPVEPCRSVLCACDLGNAAEAKAVLTAAAAIAKKESAELSILHVIELTPMAIEVDYAGFRDALVQAATSGLRDLLVELGVDAPRTVVEGPVAKRVFEHAKRIKAGLIVTGRGHQQDTFGRVWSSLYEIVREAPCPVISV